jgi:hypothetical protein
MNTREIHNPHGQVVMHILSLLLLMFASSSAVMAETVPALPPPPTAPSVGGWYLHTGGGILYPPFPGAPTGQAFCDYWKSSLSNNNYSDITITFLPAASGYGGLCTRPNPWGPGVVLVAQTGYIEYCPPGYTSPAAGGIYPQTCTNVSADNRCPAVATGETPFKLDLPNKLTCSRPDQCQPPDAFDSATGQCVKCPIELKPLPQDACTLALENLSSTQAQKDAACGKLSQAMEDGKACLARKLSSLGTPIPLSVGVGVRSAGYQKHFVDIWNQMEKLVRVTKKNPIMQAACAARRAEIAAEKGCDNAGRCESCFPSSASQRSHCLKGRPSSSNTAPHTLGNAIDVSESRTIKPLRQFLQARKPPQNIQQFLDEPPEDCKLKWGGTFTDNYDPIHFQVR